MDYKTLDFHMTTTCNHTCIFCSEDDRMKEFGKFPLTYFQIKTILIDRAKKGFNYVNFTGGEPMLFPQFLELLAFTKKLGYRIYVGSNGTPLAKKKFAEEAMQYIDVLSLSIHWYNQETCTLQIGDKTHFKKFTDICKNITLFKRAEQYFQTNIVINHYNYKDLEKIIKNILKMGYPLNHVLLSYIAPEGVGRSRYKELSVDYVEIIPYIREAKELCDAQNLNFRVFGIPLCILGEELYENSNDVYRKERHTIERFRNKEGKVALIDIYSEDNSRERVFVEKCRDCKWKNKPCTGVFEKYLEHYSF